MSENLLAQVAKIPVKQEGLDTTCLQAPLTLQVNTTGAWETCPPGNVEEKRLNKLVSLLNRSHVLPRPGPYCTECAAENKRTEACGFVPIVMVPIKFAGKCPFGTSECIKEERQRKKKQKIKEKNKEDKSSSSSSSEDDERKHHQEDCKQDQNPYKLQRFTDFDLQSQW